MPQTPGGVYTFSDDGALPFLLPGIGREVQIKSNTTFPLHQTVHRHREMHTHAGSEIQGKDVSMVTARTLMTSSPVAGLKLLVASETDPLKFTEYLYQCMSPGA